MTDVCIGRSFSSRNWPTPWGDNYQALLKFHNILADAQGAEVALFCCVPGLSGMQCFGTVPIDLAFEKLLSALPLMQNSFSRGLVDGRAALAREVLGPIQHALRVDI